MVQAGGNKPLGKNISLSKSTVCASLASLSKQMGEKMDNNRFPDRGNPEQSELANRIEKLLDEYPEMSVATMAGILQYIATDLIMRDLGKG